MFWKRKELSLDEVDIIPAARLPKPNDGSYFDVRWACKNTHTTHQGGPICRQCGENLKRCVAKVDYTYRETNNSGFYPSGWCRSETLVEFHRWYKEPSKKK